MYLQLTTVGSELFEYFCLTLLFVEENVWDFQNVIFWSLKCHFLLGISQFWTSSKWKLCRQFHWTTSMICRSFTFFCPKYIHQAIFTRKYVDASVDGSKKYKILWRNSFRFKESLKFFLVVSILIFWLIKVVRNPKFVSVIFYSSNKALELEGTKAQGKRVLSV